MRVHLLVGLLALSGCTLIGGYFDYTAVAETDMGQGGELGPVLPGLTVEVTPSTIPNDGVRPGDVTVTLRDDNLAPIANTLITLQSSRVEDTIRRVSPLAASGMHGTIQFRVTSTRTGTSTLTASAVVSGQVKTGTAELHVLPSLSLLAGELGGPGSADGFGDAARLQPSGLTWDGEALLVADSFAGLVRRIDVGTGAVSTLVGDPGFGPLGRVNVDGAVGIARFAVVSDLAVIGDIAYVTDHVSCTIRKFDRQLMQVSIVAGSGCAQAGSPAVDGAGAVATFHAPRGITAVDASTLYVADADQVRKLKIAGGTITVSTLGPNVVNGTPLFTAVVAINGDAYAIDASAKTLVKIAAGDGTPTDVVNIPAVPTGLTTDGTRLFYAFGSEIHAVLPDGSSPTTLTNQLAGASALGYDPIHRRLYAAIRTESVVSVDTTTGTVIRLAGLARSETRYAEGLGPAARFSGPSGITADPAGIIYVADRGNCRIRRIDPSTRTVSTLAGGTTCSITDGTAANARFLAPAGLAYSAAPSPALWVSEGSPACVIRRIDLTSGNVTTALGKANTCAADLGTGASASFLSPGRIASDGVGLLYVADGSTLWRTDVTMPLGRAALAMILPGTLTGLAVSAQHVYIAASGNQVVWRTNKDGSALTLFAGTQQPGAADGPALGGASFGNPWALAIGPADQTLLVSEYRNNLLRQIDLVNPAHPVTTIAGTLRRGAVAFDPVPSFNFVVDMVRIGDDFFLVDLNENAVLRYRP